VSLARQRGVRVLIIGIGDVNEGALVPAVLYHGEPVRTRQESRQLSAMGGAYLNAGTGVVDASRTYREQIAPAGPRTGDPEATDLARWPLMLAALALVWEMLMGGGRSRAIALAILLPLDLSAQSAAEWVVRGNEAFRKSQWDDAFEAYRSAARERPTSSEIQFDLGSALYQLKLYKDASQAFERAAAGAPGTSLAMRSRLGRANSEYREAMEDTPPKPERLRAVLAQFEDIPLDDARYNAEVVRKRLVAGRHTSDSVPEQPKSSDARTIVRQGKIAPSLGRRQQVDRDW
jgi:tetratricopeptide (TPR) repeat protein